MNTHHQIYMYDYLYESQDIFDFYKNQLNKKNLTSRNQNLPFSSCLFFFGDISLNNEEIEILKKIRFYSFTFRNFDFINLIQFLSFVIIVLIFSVII